MLSSCFLREIALSLLNMISMLLRSVYLRLSNLIGVLRFFRHRMQARIRFSFNASLIQSAL